LAARKNLVSTLYQASDHWPDKVAVVKGDRRFTYHDLRSAVDALAVRLSEAGVRPGDRIGLMFFSSPEAIIAYYAAWQVGAVVVSIAPASKADEVAELADQVEIDVFCYGPQFQRLFPANAPMRRHLDIETSAGCSRFHVQSAAVQRSVSPMRQNLLDVNAAAVFFSSGTTSRSKGIVFSHESLLSRSDNLTEAPAVTESDAVLWLQSTANVGSRLHLCLKQGTRIVMADNVDTAPVAALVVEHRITQIYATPMFYRALLAQSDLRAEDFSTVLYFISWSAAVPDLTAEAFRQTFGKEISQSYGLRESGQVFVNFGADIAKRGSVGLPACGYEIRIRDNSGGDAGVDCVGELLVRGEGLFDAYYQPWQLRREVLEDGWFNTGDLVRRDADGYFWIVGRLKDVISVGGVKAFPAELEAVCLSHPLVEEALVYAVPDRRFGQVPHAKIKLVPGAVCEERELMRWINQKLAVFKSIRKVEFVDELPKTATGKARRWG